MIDWMDKIKKAYSKLFKKTLVKKRGTQKKSKKS